MQPLGPRTSTAGTLYTAAQVQAQLTAPGGSERWLFDRLDAKKNWVSDLTKFVSFDKPPQISHDTRSAVQRSLRFEVRADAPYNPLSDLVRAHYQLRMPDAGFVDFTLGTFATLPPDKQINQNATWLQLNLPDVAQLLVDASFTSTKTVAAGTNYISAIAEIAADYGGPTPIPVQIQDPGYSLPASLAWDAGSTRLRAITDLLAAINFNPPWFDENGTLRSEPIPDYTTVLPSFTFDTTQGLSIVKEGATQKVDISKTFNICTVIVEDPRRINRFGVTEYNTNPASAVSIPNWRPKTKLIRDPRIIDAFTAQLRGQAELAVAARIYAPIAANTFSWPASQNLDVYGLTFQTNDEPLSSYSYLETRWVMQCVTGGSTTHTLERIF